MGPTQQEGDGAEAGQGGLHRVEDSGDGDGELGRGARDYDVELERWREGRRGGEARGDEGGGAMKVVWWRRQSGGVCPFFFLTPPITPAFIAHHHS